MKLWHRGQSIIEYTMIVSILTIVFFYMSTGIKRGVQSLVKATSDQIGNQANADQDYSDAVAGYLVQSNSATQMINNKQVGESGYYDTSGKPRYLMNTSINEISGVMTNSTTNGGFSQDSS